MRRATAVGCMRARTSSRRAELQSSQRPKVTLRTSVTTALGGQTVSIVGAGGRTYYYAHLEAYAPDLAEGDFVTTQTLLGYVGATGNAAGTPPHLHFGVYAPGGALNPLPLISDRAKEKRPAIHTQPARSRTRR